MHVIATPPRLIQPVSRVHTPIPGGADASPHTRNVRRQSLAVAPMATRNSTVEIGYAARHHALQPPVVNRTEG